ncbi:MAG: hypothetical protein NTW04_03275, partial [Elusimicrobia bacterium]|nr:hypothetical protein [Elusimicrobiota bacterium]
MEEKIKSAFPFIKQVWARRNWLSGKLHIKVLERRPIAAVLPSPYTKFVDEDGEIYPPGISAAPQGIMEVELGDFSGEHLSPESIKLIKEANSLKNSFPKAPAAIIFSDGLKNSMFRLEDGSEVDWGGADFFTEKISRLNQVFEKAYSRATGPFKINMRYFEDGKILLANQIETKPH